MSLDTEIDLLSGLALFAGVDRVRLEVLAFAAERQVLAPGDTLFEAGEPGDAAYLVVAGEAAALATGPDGLPQVARIAAGDLIGEAALLDAGARMATVRAAGELTVLKISRPLFARLVAEFPELAAGMLRANLARMETLAQDLSDLEAELAGRRARRGRHAGVGSRG